MEILERYDNMVIALLDVDKLHDHEEIKEDFLKKLIKQIKKDNKLFYPIIVDKYSNVVLDGHHRYFAIKSLGCKRITSIVVDYYNPNIKVETWHPVIKTKVEVKAVFKCLGSAGYKIGEVESEEAVKVLVEAEQALLGMIVKNEEDKFYIIKCSGKCFNDAMECIKKGLETEGFRKELDYVGDEAEAEHMLRRKKASMIMIIPQVTKEKVVEMGSGKGTFPPKTTRHILPERQEYPVSLDVLKKPNPPEQKS